VPAILLALVSGLAVTGITGQFVQLSEPLALTVPQLTWPVFSVPAILTATPLFLVLITLQANLPSLRYLQSQGYEPPDRMVAVVSAIGTVAGSLLGPTGVSLSLPATSIAAGPDAGDQAVRHRSVYLASGAALVIGLIAGVASGLFGILPAALLVTLAGLAVINVLADALRQITAGPLLLGPLFALAVAVSDISLLGFDSYFWSLVIGTGVSMLLERDGLRELYRQRDEQSRGG
jgi:benzoate membrane transport protein